MKCNSHIILNTSGNNKLHRLESSQSIQNPIVLGLICFWPGFVLCVCVAFTYEIVILLPLYIWRTDVQMLVYWDNMRKCVCVCLSCVYLNETFQHSRLTVSTFPNIWTHNNFCFVIIIERANFTWLFDIEWIQRERVSNTPLQTRINQMKALVWKRLNVRNFISFQSFHYEIDEHRNEWWHKLNCMHMNIEIPLSMPITQASLCKTFTGEWPPSDVFWLDSLIVGKIPFGHFSLSYLASKRQKC